MRVGVAALVILMASSVVSAQVDTGADESSSESQPRQEGEVRNKTTAERISSPVPTSKGVPWSFPLFWDQSFTIRSLNRGSQLSSSPNYTWWFTIAPRWLFSDVHSIGVTSTVSIEWTDSPAEDFDRPGFVSREALWEDLRLDYLFSVPKRPGGFMFFLSADLRFPTSKFSRSRERYIAPGLRALIVRPFDVLAGMQLGLGGAFWGWFAGSNVVLAPEDIGPCRVGTIGATETLDSCFGPTSSVKHWSLLSVLWTLVPVDRLAIGLRYRALWGRGFDLATGCVDTLTGPVCLDDGSPNDHWRSFSNFRAIVGYDVKRWLTLALSYDVWAQHPDSDGSRENPFYNENSRLIFTLTFRADGLYAATRDKRALAEGLGVGVEEL